MDFKKNFVTNKKKETEGVWLPGPEGSEFLIARAGNTNFTKLAGELMKPYRKLLQMGKADDQLIHEVVAEVTSKTILLGWRGLNEGGQEIAYSQQEAKQRLVSSNDFAEFIAGLSQQQAAFQDEQRDAAVKN